MKQYPTMKVERSVCLFGDSYLPRPSIFSSDCANFGAINQTKSTRKAQLSVKATLFRTQIRQMQLFYTRYLCSIRRWQKATKTFPTGQFLASGSSQLMKNLSIRIKPVLAFSLHASWLACRIAVRKLLSKTAFVREIRYSYSAITR